MQQCTACKMKECNFRLYQRPPSACSKLTTLRTAILGCLSNFFQSAFEATQNTTEKFKIQGTSLPSGKERLLSTPRTCRNQFVFNMNLSFIISSIFIVQSQASISKSVRQQSWESNTDTENVLSKVYLDHTNSKLGATHQSPCHVH